jgi:hypothetical protein
MIYFKRYDISTMIVLIVGISSLYRSDASKEELRRMTRQQRINDTAIRIILIIVYVYLFIVMVTNYNKVNQLKLIT